MLKAQLFGVPTICYEGQSLVVKGKTLLFLAYLAHMGQAVPRSDLLRLFWPTGKTHNLRQLLSSLRDLAGSELWLKDLPQTIQIIAQTDTAQFEQLAQKDPSAALALAGQPFLDTSLFDTLLLDLPELTLWHEEEKARLDELIRRTRLYYASVCLKTGQPDEAAQCLETLYQADPLDEETAQRLIGLYLQQGQQAQANAIYSHLKRELLVLGLAPHPRTTTLLGLERNNAELLAEARSLLAAALQPASPALWSKVTGLPEIEVAQLMNQQGLSQQEVNQPLAPLATLWHGRIAAALSELNERPAHVPLHTVQACIAQHWQLAGRTEEAAATFTQAAREAHRVGANEDAINSLIAALALTEGPQREELLLRQAGILDVLAKVPELRQVAQDLYQHAQYWQSDSALLGALVTDATANIRAGQPQKVPALLEQGFNIITRLDRSGVPIPSALRGRVHLVKGAVHLRAGQFELARSSMYSGLLCKPPIDLKVRLMVNIGVSYGLQNQLEESLVWLEDGLSLARQAGDLNTLASILMNLAATAERLNQEERAILGMQECVRLSKRLGMTASMQAAYTNLGIIHVRRGSFGEAWNTALEVREVPLPPEQLPPEQLLLVDMVLAEVELHCGLFSAARTRLTPHAKAVAQQGSHRFVMMVNCFLGLLDIAEFQDNSALLTAITPIANAQSADYNDIFREFLLDGILLLKNPAQIRHLLAGLDLSKLNTPNLQCRLKLAKQWLAQREGRPVNLSALKQLSSLHFAHRRTAVLLGHQLEQTAHSWQLCQNIASQQGQGLPKSMQQALLARLCLPLA